MSEIVKLFNEVRQIPGAAARVEFLKAHHIPLVDQIITDAMDPSITYGVTSKDIGIQPHTAFPCYYVKWYEEVPNLLQRLAARELTGSAAIEEIKRHLPRKIPHIFISSVMNEGIKELKDMIWKILNEE